MANLPKRGDVLYGTMPQADGTTKPIGFRVRTDEIRMLRSGGGVTDTPHVYGHWETQDQNKEGGWYPLNALTPQGPEELKKTSWNVKQHTRNLPPETAKARIMRYIRRQGFTASPARSDKFGVGPNQHHLNYNENIGDPTHELAHAYMTPPGESLREHQKKMGNLTTPQARREMSVEQHRAEEHAAYAMEPQIKRRAGVSPAEASNGSYRYHANKMPTVHDAARARGVAQLDAIDEGRKVIGPKGQVGVGTSIDAKINARALGKADELPANALHRPSERAEHTEEKSPWDVVSSAPAPTQKELGLPTWLGRPVVHKDHLPELERAAAIHEFGHKMPRQAAEMKAYNDYVHKQRVQASAHHLAGMKAANAAGDEEAARKHYLLYKMHSDALGHDAAGPAHPDVVAASAAPQKVYKFKRHAGDAFVFAGDRGGPHEFGKADLAKALKSLYDGAVELAKSSKPRGGERGGTKNREREIYEGYEAEHGADSCPHCGGEGSPRGSAQGVSTYRCKQCDSNFSVDHTLDKKEKSPEDKEMKAKDRSSRASKTTCPREGCGKYKPHWAEVCADCHHKGYALGKSEIEIRDLSNRACRCEHYNFPHRRGGGKCKSR